ncbi:MAG: LacI family DNA-binding transcriptional regulator [Fusobacteriaceae bacterium]
MSITLKIIAKELNLSFTTVSRALRDDPKIKLETREIIKRKASELNYTPNSIAKELVTKKTNSIGLIVPDITEPFISELAKELGIEAKNNGLTLYLCNTNWDSDASQKFFNTLVAKQVDGILILPTFNEADFINSEAHKELKIILVGSSIKNSNVKIFQCDNSKGIELAMNELVKKNKRKIAYLGGNTGLLANEERFLAYKNYLLKNNLEYCDSRIVNLNNKDISLSGYNSVDTLLKQTNDFDSIICFNDLVALGAIQRLTELGISIPKDVAVIGFDDIKFSKLVGIKLTTLKQPIKKMAEDCIKYFKSNSSNLNSVSLYTPDLIVRETT